MVEERVNKGGLFFIPKCPAKTSGPVVGLPTQLGEVCGAGTNMPGG